MKRNLTLASMAILMLLATLTLHAQVTIGLSEQPVDGTLLQLKEKDNIVDDSQNAYKGLGLPRVILVEKNELYPMFLSDPDDSTSGPTSEYAANKSTLDKTHTGLIVYNLKEDDEKELCIGLNQWDGTQWTCFQEKLGQAVANIVDCDDLTYSGEYKNTEALNSSNFLTVTLNVTKVGAYTIIGRAGYNGDTSTDNEYYFITSGMFLTVGVYTIQIPGSGRPLQYTPSGGSGDIITLTMNDKPLTLPDGSSCPLYIPVEDASLRAAYTMDCGQTTVNGTYVLNKALTMSNTITVWITTDDDPLVNGAVCTLQTDEVDGIKFASQSVVLTANSTIPVTLYGSGTPTSVDVKKMTITSNSVSNVATCYANVTVAYTKKVILGIGYTGTNYGYNISQLTNALTDTYRHGARKIVASSVNFGLDDASTVKVEGFEFVMGADYPTDTQLQILIDTYSPDIIVCGYNYNPTDAAVDVLIRYMENKGVVIAALEYAAGIQRLFNRTLNLVSGTVTTVTRGTAGAIYTFNYMLSDEILNGPFGDVRDKYWGEDASTTIAVNNVPTGMVDIYSTGNCYSSNLGTAGQTNGGSYITACKFKNCNLVWIGDGGFWSRGLSASDVSSSTICPLYYDSNFVPVEGVFGNALSTNIQNSIFFANAMAWAIKTAEFDGYNTPR